MNGWDRMREREDYRFSMMARCANLAPGYGLTISRGEFRDNYSSIDDFLSSCMGTAAGLIRCHEDYASGNYKVTTHAHDNNADEDGYRYHVDDDRQWMFDRAMLGATPVYVRRDDEGERHEREFGYRESVHPLLKHKYDRVAAGWRIKHAYLGTGLGADWFYKTAHLFEAEPLSG